MITIHQVKTRLVNSYVVEYSDKLLVIDVAVKCHRYVLGFIEQELGRDISDVKLVICSHDDPDHIGGVFLLAELCGAEVAIPYASKLFWKKILNNPLGALRRMATSTRELLRSRAWAMYFNPQRDRDAQEQPKFIEDYRVADQARNLSEQYRLKDQHPLPGFDDWTVIHTPGHSWDSCCFYHQATQSLVSGDTLLGSGKMEKLVLPAIYSSASQTRSMLGTLERLDIKVVYPGHGSIIKGQNLLKPMVDSL